MKTDIIKFTLLSIFLILLYGLYFIYKVYYSNYYNQVSYDTVVFTSSSITPTKLELMLCGFRDYRIVAGSVLLSLGVVYIFRSNKIKN